MQTAAIYSIAGALKALGCTFVIHFGDRKLTEDDFKSGAKFTWDDELFAQMYTLEPGGEIEYTIDPTWDYRRIQSFRTAVRTHFQKAFGRVVRENMIYNQEAGHLIVKRPE